MAQAAEHVRGQSDAVCVCVSVWYLKWITGKWNWRWRCRSLSCCSQRTSCSAPPNTRAINYLFPLTLLFNSKIHPIHQTTSLCTWFLRRPPIRDVTKQTHENNEVNLCSHLVIITTGASRRIVIICYYFASVQTFALIPAGFINISWH